MSRFVPYLADEAIERDAASLIGEYEHARGVTIEPPIPIEDIVEKYLKLRIEFDDMHAQLCQTNANQVEIANLGGR